MRKRLGEKIRKYVESLDRHHTTPQLVGSGHVESFDVTVSDNGKTKKYTVTIINHDKDDHN